MVALWRRLDISQCQPLFINDEDEIYYAREYISGAGFQASEANSLISNFKKSIDRKGRTEWRYKEDAIQQFAYELASLLDDEFRIVAAIPSSKCKADIDYDSRLDDTLKRLQRLKPQVIVEEPIAVRNTMQAAHAGGDRHPDIIYDNLAWNGFTKRSYHHVILIDDVLTTGSHYAACKRMINENHPNMDVIGVFWAKTIWI